MLRPRFAWLLLGFYGWLLAADPRPMVGPGATRDEVINAYGWPSGQSQSGSKEVLTYPQGKVTLENGRVEKVDFSMTTPWPPPRPRPGPSTAVPKKEEPVNFWLTDFDQACREAARRNARVLALFTGSDWSQASKQFREQVAFHPDFINAFTADFVFLELDFPIRTAQSPEQREHNERLRDRYGVSTYPTLLVLSPAGTVVGQVDLNKPQPGETYRDRVMAAVREMRDELIAKPPPVETPAPATSAPPPPAAPAGPPSRLQRVTAAVRSARTLVVGGVAAGVATAGFLLWLVWRQRTPRAAASGAPMAERITDAASGLPSQVELMRWPRPRLRGLLAGLAESEGYQVELRPEDGDVDIVLRRGGDAAPRVLIACVPGPSGPVPAKRVRELFASMTVEGAATGWLVAPCGFSPDARTSATENGVVLLNAESLAAQLRDLPPLILPKVIARASRPPA